MTCAQEAISDLNMLTHMSEVGMYWPFKLEMNGNLLDNCYIRAIMVDAQTIREPQNRSSEDR